VSNDYTVISLTAEERVRLQRVHDDLLALAGSGVPAVGAAARMALAHVVQAMNGQGLAYELYTASLPADGAEARG
jgi:hypothetical protein